MHSKGIANNSGMFIALIFEEVSVDKLGWSYKTLTVEVNYAHKNF
jgi:hypothetical protein